ncbi:MAG: VCBS repeat-containing protein [Bacteroidales bacterium]
MGTLVAIPLGAQYPDWDINSDIVNPNVGDQQTASLILDIDNDGIKDFVITERTASPSVVWYKYNGTTWDRMVIDETPLRIEAGGDFLDIDRDGDLDIVFGGDSRSNQIWWWENPRPEYQGTWERHLIKDHGGKKHHDQIFVDFDHDGQAELISWNQQDSLLLMFEIPSDPRSSGLWKYSVIYKGQPKDEGLAGD